MSKKIFFVLFLALSGCVIYAPKYTTQTVVQQETTSDLSYHNRVETKTTTEVKERTIQTPVTEQKRTLASCEPFVLPKAKPLPSKPSDEELAKAQSDKEIDTLIGNYVLELRVYNLEERAKIEQAHSAWLVRCQR